MAQRLGRVNRRGTGAAEIDVIYENDPDPKKKDDPFEKARWATLRHLQKLPGCDWIADRHEANPHELGKLTDPLTRKEREEIFSPKPQLVETSDILFDAWALTTIRNKLPGRPEVEPYLHGINDDPPRTTVAWREEVERLTPEVLKRNKTDAEEVLELYPLKPHEELSEPTYGRNKVFEQLEAIAARDAKREPDKRLSAWVVEPDGSVEVYPLEKLVEKDKQKKPLVPLGGRTVVLPPQAGGLAGGLLKGDEPFNGDPTYYDVSGEWYDDATKTLPRRQRLWGDFAEFEDEPDGMRLVRRFDFASADATGDEDAAGKSWYWFVRPGSADDDGSKTAKAPITWKHHTQDVTDRATKIADTLLKDCPDLHRALVLAARFHDLGKRRIVWQRSIGNPDPTNCYAKSGKDPKTGRLWKPLELTTYRHEFGSLLDVLNKDEFKQLGDEMKELVLHLIAVHHGRGRPHFPAEEVFDPEPNGRDVSAVAAEVPRRFARLQRKYGRWGLAYLESLLRAADYAASANPSAFAEEGK
jgi:CRISPR-associated endonuclease/helicase Cas3